MPKVQIIAGLAWKTGCLHLPISYRERLIFRLPHRSAPQVNLPNPVSTRPNPGAGVIRNPGSGFTLLEMMLTVGLIALTATFVGLSIGRSDAKLADLEAKRFVALLNLAQDESIVSGRPLLLTMDTTTHSYQFAPLDVSPVFVEENFDDEELRDDLDEADHGAQADSFFKQRFIPERLKIEFSLLPEVEDENEENGFVPKRVHEILNKSLFEREGQELKEQAAQNIIVIEPNGLISPFSLSLSIDEHASRIGLDRFGKAALLDL
ncbi:MAG: prepilin-type N-terminal cleavage/methylation domain-containing protein [Proteobacteria bacterium]|nr:prepilin-type N-terminal cleavage/methylation domain-containing protein [Pseudomonadota bacterium]